MVKELKDIEKVRQTMYLTIDNYNKLYGLTKITKKPMLKLVNEIFTQYFESIDPSIIKKALKYKKQLDDLTKSE